MSVVLRNVNLWSHLECHLAFRLRNSGVNDIQYACALYKDVDGVRAWRAKLGRRGESFFGDGA